MYIVKPRLAKEGTISTRHNTYREREWGEGGGEKGRERERKGERGRERERAMNTINYHNTCTNVISMESINQSTCVSANSAECIHG